MKSSPSFKEWAIIVEALGQGLQSIILRKGGISEGKGGFRVQHSRFWLFPTQYHQQLEKTRPIVFPYQDNHRYEEGYVALKYFAEISDSYFLNNWEKVQKLKEFHFWTEPVIRERFDYSKEKGLHVMIVRVFRLSLYFTLPNSAAYEGCKSWIEVPEDFTQHHSVPVLEEKDFAERRNQLLAWVN